MAAGTTASCRTDCINVHIVAVKHLLLYFATQDKRGVSATQLAFMIGVNYKTAWFMLKRIRAAMRQRDAMYLLSGTVEFDDAYFGSPTTGKKRGRGTEKAKVFVALSLNSKEKPQFLKMQVTDHLQGDSVAGFESVLFKRMLRFFQMVT